MRDEVSSQRPADAPRVTVVMPAYNRAALIGESIESVLAQTFADFELVVADDGSSDATAAVVRRVADPRVRLLELPHRGRSAAVNAGVRAGRGAYFARLDSDDLWHPEFLAATVAAMEAAPRVGVVYTRAETFAADPAQREPDRGHPLLFPGRPLESMLVHDHASAAALVRVECYDRVGGFDESMPWWEDWDFWIRVSRHCDFRFVDRVLARFRIHAANTVHVHAADAWATRAAVLDKAFAALAPLDAELTAIRRLAYRNAHFDAGLHFWQARAWRAAARQFGRGTRASGRPVHAVGRLLYLLLLQELGHLSAVRALHRVLSRTRNRWRNASLS